jgi:hypothetical protein
MKFYHRIAPAFLLLQLVGCNQPCRDCEDVAEGEEESVPDLPCAGADLKTDDLNCGACGTSCNVMWPHTKYTAGGCVDGECGRTWTPVGPLPPPPAVQTCEEFCSLGDIPCVPRGCSGMTAFVCETVGDFGDQCDLGNPLHEAIIEFSGECDEPIPYPDWFEPEGFSFINFACCCGP